MTFRIFKNSTTADASDSNDNFYHIGRGSILPMQGTLLANTTATLDMGSSTYNWKTGYFSSIPTINLESNGITWDHVATTTLDTTATSIEFTGLNSDNDISYMMYFFVVNRTSTVTQIRLCNGSEFTGTSGFTGKFIFASGTGATYTNSSFIFENAAATTTMLYSSGFLEICGTTELNKHCNGGGVTDAGEKIAGRSFVLMSYQPTSEDLTITSLSLICSTGSLEPGTSFSLFKRGDI